MTNQERSNQRIAYWRNSYLASTRKSYGMAQEFFEQRCYFTAYLYLFVTFNNLYSLRADFNGGERTKIRNAVDCIPDEWVNSFYTEEYRNSIERLNERTPEQCIYGPDAGTKHCGVVDMQGYFQGECLCKCVKHIKHIAIKEDSVEAKKCTLQNLAAELLYMVRNNQFHSIKDANNIMDEDVLQLAYCLLDPIVGSLLQLADSEEQA